MKNIFKKNQIIITALAIMIAIAGYLSFTNNDKPDPGDHIQTVNPDTDEYDIFTQMDGMDLAQNDTGADENDEDADITDAETEDGEVGITGIEAETTPVDTGDTELGDISDDDILQTAQTVKDNGEIDTKDKGIPGEAVLASATLDPGFFYSSKLTREQTRARSKADLRAIIDSTTLSEETKQDAMNRIMELTAIAEKENATEILLEARGFDGVVVTIDEKNVDVIVNASSITDQQIAIIEDIVKKKTGAKIEDISIMSVVTAE